MYNSRLLPLGRSTFINHTNHHCNISITAVAGVHMLAGRISGLEGLMKDLAQCQVQQTAMMQQLTGRLTPEPFIKSAADHSTPRQGKTTKHTHRRSLTHY